MAAPKDLGPKKIEWERTVMLKHPDTIKSSQFEDTPQFVPSYVKENVNMFYLLAHEYARIWKNEREQVKTRIIPVVDTCFLQRGYVIRGLNKKRAQKFPHLLKNKPCFGGSGKINGNGKQNGDDTEPSKL